ncbi:MAG: tryptophan halogenase family protein [Asticcacaulis sp.]|uniref:tryptophan halogenase family protein n=1 Tax=Asticcacaulis sp. TaxID=1872648 RepID=UPI003F7C1C02
MKIVILGGGTAGWMTAAAFSKAFNPGFCSVRLIESDEIGTVGVGEATLPQLKDFNDFLGLDEAEFMRETNATFKLGIDFRNWGRKGDSYIHPFGIHGQAINGVPLFQYWLKARAHGDMPSLEDYSFPIMACRSLKFDFPSDDQRSVRSTFSYAYQFDAVLYARFLRRWTEARGLKRTEGKVVNVTLRPDDGFIQSLTLASGEVIEGDLFIDCSGFRALLIGQTLQAGWEDWTPWLPCDRALTAPCDREGDFTPYTRATAQEAGWTWRIPLQHRTGNGYVFSSQFSTEERAREILLGALDGKAQAEPRLLKFAAGRRTTSWRKNCVAIGLASGFLEPLESTSIYLAQIASDFLIRMFPDRGFDPKLTGEFNRMIDIEYDRVRDFLILHYHANQRPPEDDPTGLWRYVREMTVPDSLLEKIEIFRHRGHIHRYRDGLFAPPSWIAVYTGQNILPEHYDRQVDNMTLDMIREKMEEMRERVTANVAALPTHAEFLRSYCALAMDAAAPEAGHA